LLSNEVKQQDSLIFIKLKGSNYKVIHINSSIKKTVETIDTIKINPNIPQILWSKIYQEVLVLYKKEKENNYYPNSGFIKKASITRNYFGIFNGSKIDQIIDETPKDMIAWEIILLFGATIILSISLALIRKLKNDTHRHLTRNIMISSICFVLIVLSVFLDSNNWILSLALGLLMIFIAFFTIRTMKYVEYSIISCYIMLLKIDNNSWWPVTIALCSGLLIYFLILLISNLTRKENNKQIYLN
jgi:hypothetical protein